MFSIHPSAQIHPTARLSVTEGHIGAGAVIRENAVIEGQRVVIGRDAFIGRSAWIGGGSCHDPVAELTAGDFLHLGWNCQINIARPVRIGHEVGLGVETKLFTHGAYLPAWDGFPAHWAGITLGDRVWLPNAWVNPGVTIGSDVVVAAGSVVTRDLPAGCLAAGSPAAVRRAGAFPRVLTAEERLALFDRIFSEAEAIGRCASGWTQEGEGGFRLIGGTVFDLDARRITGPADAFTEILRNQLRRNGIRFRFEAVEGVYRPWSDGP
ncbi:MAG TPA: hypothetical protein VKS60_14100 [Stellaceae bacterium]|nr:hypothetical protein [Stellaceae bacterium]